MRTWRRLAAGAVLAALVAANAAARDAAAPRVEREIADASLPNLSATEDGGVVLSWVEAPRSEASAPPRLLAAVRAPDGSWSSETDPVVVVAGREIMRVVTDPPTVRPSAQGAWFATWLEAVPGEPGASHLYVTRSADGGAHFDVPRVAHADRSAAEHGFASFVPLAEGGMGVAWLDGRAALGGGFHAPGPSTLRLARPFDDPGGADRVLDPRVCDCCATDVAPVAGGALLVYRDRDDEEVRDVSALRLADGAWSEPRRVAADGWRIDGCPVNGPAVDARAASIWVAWFTAADDRPAVRAARSLDAGVTFEPAVEVAADGVKGQVDVVVDGDGSAVVTWLARAEGRTRWLARRVGGRGASGHDPVLLAEAPESLGRPRAVHAGDALVLAWTRAAEGSSRVVVATLPLARVP